MPATDQQVQTYVDQRIRPRMEQVRALLISIQDDKALIDDIYAACLENNNPTWEDSRADGVPHLLEPSDVLAYNSYITALIPNIKDAADYAAVIKACVRAPQQG